MKNYYDILGIPKDASKDDIKKAFRTLAHKYHPDKQGGDASKFKEASEAYSVLSDDAKRKQYDMYGNAGSMGGGGFNASDFSGFQNGGWDFSNFAQGFSNGQNGGGFEFDIGDIFGDIFGGGREKVKRGRDISVDIDLSFSESIFGIDKKISVRKTTICDRCNGNGAEPGTDFKTCANCGGNGKVKEIKRSFLGSFASVKTCDHCGGSGKIPEKKCSKCHGQGVEKKEKEINLKIPAGIEDGEMLRVTGEGEAVSKGHSGDLYIKVHVKRHPLFKKEGNNLVMDLTIKLSSALLGDEYKINTLDGDITVKIPEGIKHGEILRVKGKGVPTDGSRRGDLMINVKIEIPGRLSREQRTIIEELKKRGM